MLVGLVTASLGIGGTLCYVLLVPPAELAAWTSTPLAGLAYHLTAPGWVQNTLAIALAAAAVLLLVPGIFLSMGDAEALLQRLSIEGALPGGLVELHQRLGTPVRLIDTTAAGTVFVIVLAGGRVEWLARAFAVTIAAYLLIKIAALVRLRGARTGTRRIECRSAFASAAAKFRWASPPPAWRLGCGAGRARCAATRRPSPRPRCSWSIALVAAHHRAAPSSPKRPASPNRRSTSSATRTCRRHSWARGRGACWRPCATRTRSIMWPRR